ncbi:MAG: hypothetical protein ACFB5Z_14585 [Elainellaceae cyanobacterium]
MTYLILPPDALGAAPLSLSGQRLSEFIEGHPAPRTGDWPVAPYTISEPNFYPLQILALGYPYAVDNCRLRLHKLGYADPNDWSIPLPIIRSTEVIRAARPGDIMRILTKRIAKP